MIKPVLIGMNNPQGNRPLWPDPPGCSGWRLWKMLESETLATKRDYLNAFDRYNLVEGAEWDRERGQERALQLVKALANSPVVALGLSVWRMMQIRPAAPTWYVFRDNATLAPHPSGCNRLYNDLAYVRATSLILTELYQRALGR